MELGDTKTWYEIDGDNTLRVDYPLTQNSIVWDVGAYHGEWAERIYNRHKCRVFCFEPIKGSYQFALRKFHHLRPHQMPWFNFGLSDFTGQLEIHEEKNCSSSWIQGGDRETVEMRDAVEFYKEYGGGKIDLCKINIEGDEYRLLNRMIDGGIIGHFRELQIQFHILNADSERQYGEIQMKLSRTHRQTWAYPFVWENWKLK